MILLSKLDRGNMLGIVVNIFPGYNIYRHKNLLPQGLLQHDVLKERQNAGVALLKGALIDDKRDGPVLEPLNVFRDEVVSDDGQGALSFLFLFC